VCGEKERATWPKSKCERELTDLVEKQERGLNEESASQRNSHAPPTAKLSRLLRLFGWRETQTSEDLARASLGGGGVELF